MATAPSFVASANIGFARPTTVNATPDASTTAGIETLVTAAANGTRVDRISIKGALATNPTIASLATLVRIYITDTSGLNPRLIEEILIPAVQKSATVLAASGAITFTGGLLLKSGQLLRCSVSNYVAASSQLDIVAYGGDL